MYLINKLYISQIYANSFMNNHFNDCMAGIVLSAALNDLSAFWFKNILPVKWNVFITIIASVFWEYVTPIYLETSVKDIKDVVAYIVGCIVYLLIMKVIVEINK